MNLSKSKVKSKVKNYILLHLCIWLYTGSSICSKLASQYPFMSVQYIVFTGLIFVVLGVYAIFWQQIIKRFSPSVAYSNKSVTIIWTLLYSVVFFGEGLTIYNVIGAAVLIIGVILVAGDE